MSMLVTNYNKKMILFPAGTSGNFLAQFLSTFNDTPDPNFRIDWNQKSRAVDYIGPKGTNGSSEIDFLSTVDQWVQEENKHTMISHYRQISNLLKYSDRCWIKKIVPGNYVLNYCKNVFFKKQTLETVSYNTSIADLVDGMFMNIVDFYNQEVNDTDRPNGHTVEFYNLYNTDYLVSLYKEVNGVVPDTERINWAQLYIDKQFRMYKYPTAKSMQEIIDQINPQDEFDIAAVLFAYENNWKTVDRNRLWTIDNLPSSIDGCIEFLLNNAQKYKFFNQGEENGK